MSQTQIAYFLHVNRVDKDKLRKLEGADSQKIMAVGNTVISQEMFAGWYVVYDDDHAVKVKSQANFWRDRIGREILEAKIIIPYDQRGDQRTDERDSSRKRVELIAHSPENPEEEKRLELSVENSWRRLFRNEYHVIVLN